MIADPRRLYVEMLVLLIGEMRRDPGAVAALRPAMLDLAPIVDRLLDDPLMASDLLKIAFHSSARTAVTLATFANEQEGDLGRHLLNSWRAVSTSHPDIVTAVVDWPWVADGPTNDETAYLVALATARRNMDRCEPGYYGQLLRGHSVQSKTFFLPLAGDVTAWVFQDAPFSPGEDVPVAIEEAARIMEEFTRAPFPTTDVILLTSSEICLSEGYAGYSMVLNRNYAGEVRQIPHETGHYYFDFGTKWLVEGGAELVRAYVEDRKGVRSLDEARTEASNAALLCSNVYEIENILHYTYHDNFFPYACAYPIGEAFLLSLVDALGEGPVAAALRELRSLGSDARWEGSLAFEKLIYDTLLKHMPPDKQADFLNVYGRLHGGPELPDIPDDHGDSVVGATAATVGEAVTGRLDYRFDLDFFRFPAEEGRSYRISVNHSALQPSAIWMYSPEGYDLGSPDLERHWRSGTDPNGPWILWAAPSSGDYYAAVENFADEDGAYTLTIAPLD